MSYWQLTAARWAGPTLSHAALVFILVHCLTQRSSFTEKVKKHNFFGDRQSIQQTVRVARPINLGLEEWPLLRAFVHSSPSSMVEWGLWRTRPVEAIASVTVFSKPQQK